MTCGIPTCNQPARAHYWQVRRTCLAAGIFVPEAHPWEAGLPRIGEGLRLS